MFTLVVQFSVGGKPGNLVSTLDQLRLTKNKIYYLNNIVNSYKLVCLSYAQLILIFVEILRILIKLLLIFNFDTPDVVITSHRRYRYFELFEIMYNVKLM